MTAGQGRAGLGVLELAKTPGKSTSRWKGGSLRAGVSMPVGSHACLLPGDPAQSHPEVLPAAFTPHPLGYPTLHSFPVLGCLGTS